jgi:HEPN domain-containing protein
MSGTDEYLMDRVRKAEEDHETAATLIRKLRRPTPNAVCFHRQQCADKYLKAFLIRQGIPFFRPHDLRELRRLATTTVEEAREAVVAMKAVRRFVRGKMGSLE